MMGGHQTIYGLPILKHLLQSLQRGDDGVLHLLRDTETHQW